MALIILRLNCADLLTTVNYLAIAKGLVLYYLQSQILFAARSQEMDKLKDIWNFDFDTSFVEKVGWKPVFGLMLAIAVGYPILEVGFSSGNAAFGFDFMYYLDNLKNGDLFSLSYGSFEKNFPHIWLMLALGCIVFRTIVIVHSYYLSKREIGEVAFNQVFMRGLSAFLAGTVGGVALLAILGGLAWATGLTEEMTTNPIAYLADGLKLFFTVKIPTVFEIKSYPLAIVLSIFLGALPGYFVHWLTHVSRFFWLITHRAHHVMEYLFPLANPAAFNFNFLLSIPGLLVSIAASKLIYHEPLVMEMAIWGLLAYYVEIFNHSIAHYRFSYGNPLIRNWCRIFGGQGTYHLVHHSAFPQDHNVNLGGGPFMFWDRLFGTYRKPYADPPPLGLTNQPEIIWNPFRISFSGFAQLWYEWKMNKDWSIRFNILFGSIWYKPPVTKDFLIKSPA
jgi:sterol desaturase/sphingolipid hydroxylase (fatty acid hydroxylase superfamily)